MLYINYGTKACSSKGVKSKNVQDITQILRRKVVRFVKFNFGAHDLTLNITNFKK